MRLGLRVDIGKKLGSFGNFQFSVSGGFAVTVAMASIGYTSDSEFGGSWRWKAFKSRGLGVWHYA